MEGILLGIERECGVKLLYRNDERIEMKTNGDWRLIASNKK